MSVDPEPIGELVGELQVLRTRRRENDAISDREWKRYDRTVDRMAPHELRSALKREARVRANRELAAQAAARTLTPAMARELVDEFGAWLLA